jgi:DNA polymerase-3 subunit beta
MKFIIEKNILLQALLLTKHGIMTAREASNSRMSEIFRSYHFKVEADTLVIATSNSEIFMSKAVSIENPANESRQFVIFTYYLLNGIKTLDNQKLTIEVFEYQAVIHHSIGSFAVPLCEGAEECFRIPVVSTETAHHLTMEAPGLLSVLNKCSFAMANDALRPVMNGIMFNLQTDHAEFAASDGHKLVKVCKKSIVRDNPAWMIMPDRIVRLLQKILPKTGWVDIDFIQYEIDWPADSKEPQSRALCHIVLEGQLDLTFKAIEGRYPNYNSVIPTNHTRSLTIDRLALIKSFERLHHFTAESGLVTIRLSKDTMRLESKDVDFAIEANEAIACQYDGEDMKIGLKDESTLQILKNLKSEKVVFQLTDPSRAAIILPEPQPDCEEITMLVMPMLVND